MTIVYDVAEYRRQGHLEINTMLPPVRQLSPELWLRTMHRAFDGFLDAWNTKWSVEPTLSRAELLTITANAVNDAIRRCNDGHV